MCDFVTVFMFYQVILYFMESNPLGHVLLKRCRDADYECHLVHSEDQVIEQLEDIRHQAVIVIDTCHKASGSSAAAADKSSSVGKRVAERSLEKLSRLVQKRFTRVNYVAYLTKSTFL